MKHYIKIWEKIKEDLDEDLGDFFSKQDDSKYPYFSLLPDLSLITEIQLIRLLRKILKGRQNKNVKH